MERTTPAPNPQSRANLVLIAGILFNLSISVLYSWSVIKSQLMAPIADGGFGWTSAQAGLPYTVAIVFFAIGVLVGGIIQDRIGPRKVISAGGLFVGLGLIFSSLAGDSFMGITIAYGIVTGTGIGLGYGCVSPCALKWFHPSKKGMVTGLVVGGFGLAAVYLAPAAKQLLSNFGISSTFMLLGVVTAIVAVVLAQFIDNPKPGYIPAVPKNLPEQAASPKMVNVSWKDMVKTKEFMLMFALFALSSSVGLMVIGNISKIAGIQDPINAAGYAALLVALLAVFNTVGRVIGGMLSDKIGRINTLLAAFVIQAVNMLLFSVFDNFLLFTLGALLVGFSYGTLLSVFPSMTADLFGLKNYGTNYGIVFLGWGLSGVLAPVIADIVLDLTGTFTLAYFICAAIMAVCLFLGFLCRKTLTGSTKVIDTSTDLLPE